MAWSDITSSILNQGIAAFGQSVTYIPAKGTAQTISGVLDASSTDLALGHGAPVSSVSPKLGIRLADLSSKPAKGDVVQIGSATYRVIDVENDGQGGTSLRLQKQ